MSIRGVFGHGTSTNGMPGGPAEPDFFPALVSMVEDVAAAEAEPSDEVLGLLLSGLRDRMTELNATAPEEERGNLQALQTRIDALQDRLNPATAASTSTAAPISHPSRPLRYDEFDRRIDTLISRSDSASIDAIEQELLQYRGTLETNREGDQLNPLFRKIASFSEGQYAIQVVAREDADAEAARARAAALNPSNQPHYNADIGAWLGNIDNAIGAMLQAGGGNFDPFDSELAFLSGIIHALPAGDENKERYLHQLMQIQRQLEPILDLSFDPEGMNPAAYYQKTQERLNVYEGAREVLHHFRVAPPREELSARQMHLYNSLTTQCNSLREELYTALQLSECLDLSIEENRELLVESFGDPSALIEVLEEEIRAADLPPRYRQDHLDQLMKIKSYYFIILQSLETPHTTTVAGPEVATTSFGSMSPISSAFALTDFPTNRSLRTQDLAFNGGEYVPQGEGRNPALDSLAVEAKALGLHLNHLVEFDLDQSKVTIRDLATGEETADSIEIHSNQHYPVCEAGENRSQVMRYNLDAWARAGHTVHPALGSLEGSCPFFVPGIENFVERNFTSLNEIAALGEFGSHGPDLRQPPLYLEAENPVYRRPRFFNIERPTPLFTNEKNLSMLNKAEKTALRQQWMGYREHLMTEYYEKIVREGGTVYCYNKGAQVVLLGLIEAAERTSQDLSKVTVVPIHSDDCVVSKRVPEFRACVDQLLGRVIDSSENT